MKRTNKPKQSRLLTDQDVFGNFDQHGPRNRFSGFFRGIVDENADPLQLGRLKVRIFQIHGDELIKPEDLPWANACFPPGGGSDFGTFVIPPKGANVWIGFEQGDPQFPVWFGSWKTNSSSGKKLSAPKPENPQHIPRDQSMGNTTWNAPAGNELPREAQAMAHHEPTLQTWNKSPKGHTIHVEERDGVERLQITDRAGNTMFMECPVDEAKNAGNASQRGSRSVLTGDAIDREDMRDKGSKIVLQDQAQSQIAMDSRLGDENITIVANDGDGGIQNGKNRQKIEFIAGANRILVESVRDGKILARLTLDANAGIVTVEGEVLIDLQAPHVNITADHINLNGHVNISGDMTHAGRRTGGGD